MISKPQKTLKDFITGEVIVDFYVLSPIMKDKITANVNGILVVAKESHGA